MAEKFACMQCGFVFDDPDMEMCPQCGTEIGKEWNPDELVDVLVTDLSGANVPNLIRVIAEISGYPTQKIGPMLQKLPAVVYSGATPMQADAYLDKIRATNAAAMAESCHDKSVRMTAEANAAGAAAVAATEQARLSAAERQAQLDAEMKLKAEQAEAEARANAELNAKLAAERAETEKAIAEEKAKAEAEARAKAEAEAQKAETEKAIAEAEAQKAQAEAEAQKAEAEKAKAEADAKFAAEKAKAEAEALAQAEIEKKRLEFAAEEKAKQDVINAQKRKKRTILISIIAVVVVAAAALLISHICEQNRIKAYEKQRAAEKAEADRKAALEQQRIENKLEEIKKLPVPKFRWREDVKKTRTSGKVVQEFYRTKGAASVFVSSLSESAGFKYGFLATYSFPSEVIFEKIFYSKIECTEVFASGEERTVTFDMHYKDYLIEKILINGIKFDLNKSLDDLL